MSSNNMIVLHRSVNEELSVNYMGFLYFCRMNYKQYALLLWLVASVPVVGAVASSCGQPMGRIN